MSFRSFAAAAVLALFATACQSNRPAVCADTQAIVDAMAAKYPEIVRLTVHTTPAGAKESIAVASTLPAKRGKASDVEDLNAMRRGETIVIEEVGALDVTVPICRKGALCTAAAGVTLTMGPGADKQKLTELGNAIGKEIEGKMALMGK